MNEATKGHSVVVGPDEGRSLWQPLPSRGYVTVNLTADNMAYDTISIRDYWHLSATILNVAFYPASAK